MNREQLVKYIEVRLDYASRMPSMALVFEAQAFGALELYAICVYENGDSQEEMEVIEEWNNNWQNLFRQLYMEG